jgi:hypothetical protein
MHLHQARSFGGRAPHRTRALSAAITFMLAIVTLPFLAAPAAQAEVIDVIPPMQGCLDSDAAGVGFREDDSAKTLVLDSEGPVLLVIVEWMGIWEDPPADPELDIEVTGPSGTNTGTTTATSSAVDPAQPALGIDVYGYYDNITDLFGDGSAGTYSVELTPPPDDLGPPQNHWWGATVTVVYDTTPCGEVTQVFWKVGADYYFGGQPQTPVTTNSIVYDFEEPLAEDTLVSLRTSHGGADTGTGSCRVSVVWVATGTGAAPAETDDLVNDDGTVALPGAVEGIIDPFTPPNQPCPAALVNDPVQSSSGGHVGPQYALVEFEVFLDAGTEWLAIQLESPQDNNGESGLPESGAWAGAGLLVFTIAQQEIAPDIALEKTVLDGSGGACPGVEGTDELVTGPSGTPVTYCFRVINTGDTALFPVVIDDPDLGITQDDMTLVSGDDTAPLQPGASSTPQPPPAHRRTWKVPRSPTPTTSPIRTTPRWRSSFRSPLTSVWRRPSSTEPVAPAPASKAPTSSCLVSTELR